MADMITRCPKCGTAFRISDALLKSAKGVVRCGSCLSVFNARDHLEPGRTSVSPPPRPENARPARQTPPPPAPPPTPPAPPPATSLIDEEDDDVDMPDWRRRSAQDEGYDQIESFREQEPEDDDEDDEAWALELLKDDDDLNIQFKKVTPKPAVTPPAPRIENEVPPSPPAKEVADTFAEIDEQLAPLDAPYPPAAPFGDPPAANVNTGSGSAEITVRSRTTSPTDTPRQPEEPDDEQDLQPEPPPEPPKRKPIRPKLEPKSTPLKDVIASLEPEPLEVDWQEPGAWRRRLLWPLLALVALLCLLAQVAWLEFDRLSRVEPYRSAYGVLCGVIGCELPELLDRSQIQTSNLLVRSHPELADALQVDVILQNNAPFEQTFPVLELTFTNLRSEPVATRRLDPADYLGGELAGRDKMPVRQPIHIALEIADPGSDAVSYHITIVD